MRCSRCAADILEGSRFCGICGWKVEQGPQPAAAGRPARDTPVVAAGPQPRSGGGEQPGAVAAAAPPLVAPIPGGTRWARILAVLVLDVILAGAGIIMISSYVHQWNQSREVPAASTLDEIDGEPEPLRHSDEH